MDTEQHNEKVQERLDAVEAAFRASPECKKLKAAVSDIVERIRSLEVEFLLSPSCVPGTGMALEEMFRAHRVDIDYLDPDDDEQPGV